MTVTNPKSGSEIITIMRNVTGRVDSSDPLFSDSVMLGYINDFLNLIMPQDVRLFENKTWYEFNTVANTDTYAVNLDTLGYSTLGSNAYIDGFDLQWFQSPALFFGKWQETQTYTAQRPIDVLYYDNELIFRAPPDAVYSVKIEAYAVEPLLEPESAEVQSPYFWRYAAYGAALDLFSDYGEMDEYQKYYPVFMRYKSLVYARTNQQLMSQRSTPTF